MSWYPQGIDPRTPTDTNICDAKVLISNGVVFACSLYLHTGYSKICLPSFHAYGLTVGLGTWQNQFLFFGSFWDFFP